MRCYLKRGSLLLALFLVSPCFAEQTMQSTRDQKLYQLAKTNLKEFAEELTQGSDSELEKVRSVIQWLAKNFEWKATDYQKRTVQEIISNGGGNCNELAMVAVATLKELNITMRNVHEIDTALSRFHVVLPI